MRNVAKRHLNSYLISHISFLISFPPAAAHLPFLSPYDSVKSAIAFSLVFTKFHKKLYTPKVLTNQWGGRIIFLDGVFFEEIVYICKLRCLLRWAKKYASIGMRIHSVGEGEYDDENEK